MSPILFGSAFNQVVGSLCLAHVRSLKLIAYASIGVLIGWLAWGSSDSVMPLILIAVLPWLWGLSQTRGQAAALIAGYYFAASRALPSASEAFFGDASSWWLGLLLWIASGLLLCIPFCWLWTLDKRRRAIRFSLAVIIVALPPLGIIGWTSPITIAGALFPGLNWFGLLLTFAFFWALIVKNRLALFAMLLIVVLAHGAYHPNENKDVVGWQAMDTHFPQLGSDGAFDPTQLLMTFERIEWIKAIADDVPPNTVTVLPETIVGSMNDSVRYSLKSVEQSLLAKGSFILAGAELPLADGRYQNVAVLLGDGAEDAIAAVQGLPVPFGMWKPWTRSGATMDLVGQTNVISANHRRIGVLICYEQALPYTVLKTMISRPDALVMISNVWWAKKPDIPNIQHQTTAAFSRLFGIPYIEAINK